MFAGMEAIRGAAALPKTVKDSKRKRGMPWSMKE